MYRKWTTGLLKYQQYMLTTCDVGTGGGGGGGGRGRGECDNALHHTYTTRCGCIQQTAHSEARFNTVARSP